MQTAAVTQIKEFDVEAADDLESLKRIIFDEFNSLLASLRPDQTVLLCRTDVEGGGGGGGGGDGWHLVTSESDLRLMDRCTTLKLVATARRGEGCFPARLHLQRARSATFKFTRALRRRGQGGQPLCAGDRRAGQARVVKSSAARSAEADRRPAALIATSAVLGTSSRRHVQRRLGSDDSAAPSRPDRTTARTVIGVPSADVRENRTRAPARGWDEDDLGSRRAARSTAIADDLL